MATQVNQYLTGELTLDIGETITYADIVPAALQDGWGFQIMALEVAARSGGDTANTGHIVFVSAKTPARTSLLFPNDINDPDILAAGMILKSRDPLAIQTVISGDEGIMLARPIFVTSIRLGVSADAAPVAAAAVIIAYRLTIQPIKLDQAMMTEIYLRAGT